MTTSALPGPLLLVDHATKRYGGVTAVQDISFDVQPNEIVGLIGPNGAGKTSLINLITGTTRPTSGSIQYQGRRIDGLRPHVVGQMGIARTFQVVRPFATLSVRENVAVGAMFGAGGSGRSAQNALLRADEVLDLVGLKDQRLMAASSLPIGGRKRLEVARALAMEPRLLLLDEAMAGLRGSEVDDAIDLIRRVHASGVTLLIIEHVMKVIVGLCQRVVVLDYGKKIAEGTPQQVTSDPAVIRAYLGSRYQSAHPASTEQASA